MEGSLTTIPLPFAKTIVLAVPRSIARSLENRLRSERGDQDIIGLLIGVRVNDALAVRARDAAPRRKDRKGNVEGARLSRGSSAGGARAPAPFDSDCNSSPFNLHSCCRRIPPVRITREQPQPRVPP